MTDNILCPRCLEPWEPDYLMHELTEEHGIELVNGALTTDQVDKLEKVTEFRFFATQPFCFLHCPCCRAKLKAKGIDARKTMDPGVPKAELTGWATRVKSLMEVLPNLANVDYPASEVFNILVVTAPETDTMVHDFGMVYTLNPQSWGLGDADASFRVQNAHNSTH